MHGALGVVSCLVHLARRHTSQDLECLVNGLYRPDVELAGFDCLNEFFAQHYVAHISSGDYNALLAGKALDLAGCKEPLNLPSDPADGLDRAVLIHRAGYRDALAQRHSADAGKQGQQFRAGGAIALDLAVALFKADAGGTGQGLVGGIFLPQVAAEYQNTFAMNRSRQLYLALDIDNSCGAQRAAGSNASRHANGVVAQHSDLQAVYLAEDLAFGLD